MEQQDLMLFRNRFNRFSSKSPVSTKNKRCHDKVTQKLSSWIRIMKNKQADQRLGSHYNYMKSREDKGWTDDCLDFK